MARTPTPSLLVIDSWPVLQWFRDLEPGASYFQEVLEQAQRGERRLLMSVVNVGEVFYSVAKLSDLATAEVVVEALGRLNIETVSADDATVMQAARLKASYAVAYGDAFAAALAMQISAPLLTGDSEFRLIEAANLIQVEWISTVS